jgi:hypothetical protein
MVEVAALSIDEARSQLDVIVSEAAEPQPGKDDLLAVYETLLAVTGADDGPARPLLDDAARFVSAAEPAVVESLPTRARVAMRLLRLGCADAAWPVLVDGGTGVVRQAFHATTSSGAQRADWPLPLLTAVEAPKIYAELPGFRDPRYAAPDVAYEIGAAIKLRCQLEEVIARRRPVLAGWAALDVLRTEPDEHVTVVAVCDGQEIRWPGARCRRADLVGGSRDTLRRRAWAGWRAELAPHDLAGDARWALWLEVGQQGVVRRARLGKSVGELADRAVGRPLSDRPLTKVIDGAGGWSLASGSAAL